MSCLCMSSVIISFAFLIRCVKVLFAFFFFFFFLVTCNILILHIDFGVFTLWIFPNGYIIIWTINLLYYVVYLVFQIVDLIQELWFHNSWFHGSCWQSFSCWCVSVGFGNEFLGDTCASSLSILLSWWHISEIYWSNNADFLSMQNECSPSSFNFVAALVSTLNVILNSPD